MSSRPYILNQERSGLPMNNGWELIVETPLTEPGEVFLTNLLMAQVITHSGPIVGDDSSSPSPSRIEYLKRPLNSGVLYRAGRYRRTSTLRPLRPLSSGGPPRGRKPRASSGTSFQSRPEYRGTTTLIVSTDHGRGDPPRGWRDHGEKTKGSDAIWIAAIGPDTPALGERTNTPTVTQGQVAATMAALLGEDYLADAPKAARPIADVVQPAVHGKPRFANRHVRGSPSARARRSGTPAADSGTRSSATQPELFLFLGDNIYADTENMDVMRAKYAKLAAMPGFKALRERCPILATWDDHDLGVNDGGSEYPRKEESQQVFLDFFGDSERFTTAASG